ncbi:MAG: DUF262 domain-containing protein [Verrucomicrobiota bacterium]
MAKTEATVQELVDMIQRGKLRLPEMQRRYVWRSTRVRDLMDSLYRGYPSGAILVWESDEDVPLQEMSVSQERSATGGSWLLLDGQQRLTSLSAVIRGVPVSVRGRTRPVELLFNLEHPEALTHITEVHDDSDEDAGDDDDAEEAEGDSSDDEMMQRFNRMAFVVATKKLQQSPHWVKVSDVFQSDSDTSFLKAAGITGFDDPRYERYSQRLARLRAIRKYTYRLDVLERSLDYNEVTEIFVRVNSLGAKLRSSDLALAQITARWKNSLSVFESFQRQCAAGGFDLDLGLHLRNLVAFATGQSRFLRVANLEVEKLKPAWQECLEGMEFAINFMKSNAGIDSPALLSSPFMLITVAIYGHRRQYHLGPEEGRQLRQWILLANAKGRYSRGSSETILDQDLASIREGGAAELLEKLRQQVGRLDIAPAELEGRNQRSALFKTMFLAFRASGATDWRSKLVISLDHSGSQHRLQFHHVFPKAVLKGAVTTREADDIANLAFIGGKTNRSISDKEPAVYLPPLVEKCGAQAFVSQCIPTDPVLLSREQYKAFLVRRRELIAAALNRFLGTEPSDGL